MKNFIISTLLIIGIGYLIQSYFPWWTVVILAVIIGFIIKPTNGFWGYITGFVAVALLWGMYAGYLDAQNAHILSTKMGNLFGALSSFSMILLTSLIGGIIGGLGTLTGYFGKNLIS